MSEVSLKEYIETRIVGVEDAIEKSERLLEIRLATMNEFREALKDQSSQMATKESLDSSHRHLDLRVQSSLERYKAYLLGGAVTASAIVATIISFVAYLIDKSN